jgi:hypothetical protein
MPGASSTSPSTSTSNSDNNGGGDGGHLHHPPQRGFAAAAAAAAASKVKEKASTSSRTALTLQGLSFALNKRACRRVGLLGVCVGGWGGMGREGNMCVYVCLLGRVLFFNCCFWMDGRLRGTRAER